MTNRPRSVPLFAALSMLAALAATAVLGQEPSRTQERAPGHDSPRDDEARYETSLDVAQVEKVVVTVADDGTYRFSVRLP